MSVVQFPNAGHNSPERVHPVMRPAIQKEYDRVCAIDYNDLYPDTPAPVRENFETEAEYLQDIDDAEHVRWCFERRRWKYSYEKLTLAVCLGLIPPAYWSDNLNYDEDIARFEKEITYIPSWDVYIATRNGVQFQPKFRQWLFWMQRGVCGYCGCALSIEDTAGSSVDHMMPRSRGGRHMPPNLMLTCVSCNSSKRDRTVEEFRDLVRRQKSPAYGVISKNQMRGLIEAGIDLKIPRGHKFVFEHMMWKHVAGVSI